MMMKKVAIWLLPVLLVCMALLPGCQKNANVAGGGSKELLKFWYPFGGDSEKWELWVIDEFMKDNPGYTVESTYVPEGAGIRNGKLMAAINSGDVPDLIESDALAETYGMAAQGGFEPLDDVFKEVGINMDNINPAVIPLMKYNGVTYIFPHNTDTILLFYRTDLFEEAGLDPSNPPKTIAELDEYAQKLTVSSGQDVTRYGFIPWLDAGADAPTWYRQFGASVYNDSTDTLTLANPAVARVFEWQRSYAQRHDPERMRAFTSSLGAAFSPDHAFMQSKVAMTVIGNWFCNALRIYAPDTKFNVAPIPAIDAAHYGGCSLTGNNYASPKGAKNVKAAVVFADYTEQSKILEDNNAQWRSLGVYKGAFEGLSLYENKDPYLMVCIDVTFNQNSGQWVLSPITNLLNDRLTAFRDEAIYTNNDIMNGLRGVETALQTELNRALQRQ
ncbi:MAG: extracellular solute-binding protein [Treponema sp.]|jgi:multiple sugar transport system substrate-binding protein|nr:extracellular solute-binding protein [Treponema sp.]